VNLSTGEVSLAKSPEKYLAGFAVTAILSWLLLMLFPFYPAELTIILALGLGIVGVKSVRSGLMLATLLTMIAAMYQGEMVGLTVFIVLVLASPLDGWNLASMVTSWILTFLTPFPSLAILPVVASGLYERQGEALRLGVLSGVTIFLLSWTRSLSNAGLILVPSTSLYAAKSIPSPWYLTLFMSNVDAFNLSSLTNYYAPLLANLNDYRVYVALITWMLAGYITGLLISTKKRPLYFVSGLVGVLPAAVAGLIITKTPSLQVVAAIVLAAVLPLVYLPIRSRVEARRKGKRVQAPAPAATGPKDGRQLAAIMVTDVVGYTALAKEDESVARTLLTVQKERLRPILERHNGREIKSTGDTRIVEFTNALDAVNCAVEIQTFLEKEKLTMSGGKEMKIRIGLHLGDVIHREGDVLGEAVNVASRIEILADPGGVCISRQVYDQVWSEVDYEMTLLGPQELKNVQYPTEIYRVSPKKIIQQSR
jgi:class 3 adenylate cyclase